MMKVVDDDDDDVSNDVELTERRCPISACHLNSQYRIQRRYIAVFEVAAL